MASGAHSTAREGRGTPQGGGAAGGGERGPPGHLHETRWPPFVYPATTTPRPLPAGAASCSGPSGWTRPDPDNARHRSREKRCPPLCGRLGGTGEARTVRKEETHCACLRPCSIPRPRRRGSQRGKLLVLGALHSSRPAGVTRPVLPPARGREPRPRRETRRPLRPRGRSSRQPVGDASGCAPGNVGTRCGRRPHRRPRRAVDGRGGDPEAVPRSHRRNR